MKGHLTFQDGTTITGESFGFETPVAGEIAFSTSMMGYPESLTDPSYKGQILTFSYPLIGSYGVSDRTNWESNKIQISGLIVSQYIEKPSHFQSQMSLAEWLKKEKIPALEIPDTRFIVKKIRDEGASLVKIEFDKKIAFTDPNKLNLVAQVSTPQVRVWGKGDKTIILIDCGVKMNIIRELVKRGVKVVQVPWDFDFIQEGMTCDGILISNGPGDPKMVPETIAIVKKAMGKKIPIFGICLGNQILALASRSSNPEADSVLHHLASTR